MQRPSIPQKREQEHFSIQLFCLVSIFPCGHRYTYPLSAGVVVPIVEHLNTFFVPTKRGRSKVCIISARSSEMAVYYIDEQEAEPIKSAAFLLSAALKSPAEPTNFPFLSRFIYRSTHRPFRRFSPLPSRPMKYVSRTRITDVFFRVKPHRAISPTGSVIRRRVSDR